MISAIVCVSVLIPSCNHAHIHGLTKEGSWISGKEVLRPYSLQFCHFTFTLPSEQVHLFRTWVLPQAFLGTLRIIVKTPHYVKITFYCFELRSYFQGN